MMGLFIIICLFLVVGGALYYFILQGAGYLLIVWGTTSIEMSLWVAVALLLLLFFSLWLINKIYHGGINSVLFAKNIFSNRSHQKAHQLMIAGLTDFIEGNWLAARKKLERSAPKVDSPLINYLAAARSAYELGEEQDALALLHKAENSSEQGHLAIALTQARMQLANKQYEQAIATLERASKLQANHPGLLQLKQQTFIALEDWHALKALLPTLTKNSIGTPASRLGLQITLYTELLSKSLETNAEEDEQVKIQSLRTIWSSIPSDIQQEESLLSLYASRLMALGDHENAEKALKKGLDQHWNGQWIDLYGLLQCADPKKTLATAEKWGKQKDSAGLLLALGRLCVLNEQWGRAIDYFKQSLTLQERAETYAELARVQEKIGEAEKSQDNYKKGLLFSTTALVDVK